MSSFPILLEKKNYKTMKYCCGYLVLNFNLCIVDNFGIYSTGSSSVDDGASWDDASQGRPVLRLAVEY